MAHVYLVPGFFGFADIGELRYFSHVREFLGAALDQRSVNAHIHYVPTLPTASLRARTAHLLEAIAETASGDDDDLHIVGHSSGGLDARILVTPEVQLPTLHDPETYASRVRSVVTISTPHHGTPFATFFTGMLGQRILTYLSLMTIHTIRIGTVPLPAIIALARAISAPDSLPLLQRGVLDQFYQSLLVSFDEGRRKELVRFFGEMGRDRGLIPQIEPEGADLLQALAPPRDTVRYGCVLSRARPPSIVANALIGLSPRNQALYALYRVMHSITSAMPEKLLPALDLEQKLVISRAYDGMPDPFSNDAVVPTLSQVFGDVIHAHWGDHLDAIGHFQDPRHDPPHVEWLYTASGFDRPRFVALWSDVADFIAAS